MWIFTTFGFFSVVAHRTKPGVLLVRARVRSDLEAFSVRVGLEGEVTENVRADYRYRLEAPAVDVARVISEELTTMDYDNFKSRVEETQGADRESVYMGIWSHLRRYLR
jgi:hypothetical protein